MKIWNATLVEIIHPGSPKVNLGQEDLRKVKQGEADRERDQD